MNEATTTLTRADLSYQILGELIIVRLDQSSINSNVFTYLEFRRNEPASEFFFAS